MPTQAIVPVPVSEFAIARRSEELAQVIRENMGNGQMTPFDLERVKIPTGGGKAWTLANLDGERNVSAITGVIVAWREPRAYWEKSIDEGGGNTPPDCSSEDGRLGMGMFGLGSELHPTGDCVSCPMSQWGSKLDSKGNESRGQACKQMRLLFMVQPEQLLPTAVFLPPTSIKPLRQYFMRLSTQGVPYYGVVTALELEQDNNNAGIKFSRAAPRVLSTLTPDERQMVRAYAVGLQTSLDAVAVTRDDVDSVDD